jgi:hypothetical protein
MYLIRRHDPSLRYWSICNSGVTIMHYRSKPEGPAKEMPARIWKLTPAIPRTQPVYRPSRQLVEGPHGHLQIFDLRILCLVMTKPGE